MDVNVDFIIKLKTATEKKWWDNAISTYSYVPCPKEGCPGTLIKVFVL